MMKNINFYTTENGRCPVIEFLNTLTDKETQKVTWVLELIKELDNVPTSYLKKLTNTDGIWEVRAQAGNNIFRLLGFFEGANLIILNHGFQKKTQKTPKSEIKTAQRRQKDYLLRKE
ncbi:MAG: phage-related protein [Phenylobacterium sp.]|jgi:phage-related protein